jgi:DNA-binding LytR/AlgR family response regulator
MRVLIADDEPIARLVMRELLEECPGVLIAGEAASGLEAVECIERVRPEVAFLDLQMPGMDGFSVIRALRGARLPLVVFVTAYESHALQAFDSGAIDYLLKPVRKERLLAALDKAKAQLKGMEPPAPQPSTEPRRVIGRLGSDLHVLDPADVIAFRAEGDTVLILASSGRYYSDQSLKELEARFPPPAFRRIHRSTLIQAAHIRKISPLSSKRWLLTMSNGLEVTVSKRMAGALREIV